QQRRNKAAQAAEDGRTKGTMGPGARRRRNILGSDRHVSFSTSRHDSPRAYGDGCGGRWRPADLRSNLSHGLAVGIIGESLQDQIGPSARASTATATLAAPDRSSTSAASLQVVPVVSTSSTSKTRAPRQS